MKKLAAVIFSSFFIIFLPMELPGQTTGKIEGITRDAETGEPLGGVQVTVEGTLLGNITDDNGYYFLLNVPAGLHTVKAQLIGYQSVMVKDQRILAGHTHTIDFELEPTIIELPGQVVEGERSPLMPRDATDTKHRITFEAAQSLPTDNYRDLITLQAGVLKFGGSYSIRGGRTTEDAVYIDGIDVSGIDIPEFGIEEIDVLAGSYSPRFGDAQSGVINIVTREGGRELSGQFRVETDEINPSSSNYGYNQAQFSLSGPVPSIENLSFFFSTELVGKGDNSPRAAGFKGTTEDLIDIGERFSNSDQVRGFLGHELDIAEMMRTAQRENPDLPILNLSDLRRERFGGSDFEGRLPGNRKDEYRIQGKLRYQPSRNIKLIGTYLEERKQGLSFNRSRIFWTKERNSGSISRNRLGIVGYDQTLSQSAERSTNISIRGSYQRNRSSSGSLFDLNETSATFGSSMGYHSQTSLFNFMFQDVPIFERDLFVTNINNAPTYDFALPTSTGGDNPFGIPVIFADSNEGFSNSISNNKEDRVNLRLDFDSQLNRVHRLRAGAELRVWRLDKYSDNFTDHTFINFYNVRPNMTSFYLEDRLDYRDIVIDLGFRVDSFEAGTSYPSVFGDQFSPRVHSRRKTEASPRLGVAHPITERTNIRVSYGTKFQIPQFGNLYDNLHRDVDQQGNTNNFFGNPDLGFQKTTSFEVGFSALLSDNWFLDIVGYNRDFDGNVAARYLKQEGSTRFLRIYSNVDHGNVKGMDTTLRKRFNDYFSTDFTYTLIFSRSTGTDPNDFVNNEGFFVVGGSPPLPPIQPAPNNFDQTHTFNSQFNLQLPTDFREGTSIGRMLRDTGVYFTFQANSGRPYTRQDLDFNFVEDINLSRRNWQSMANLRVTRDFTLGGLNYTAFADIRNIFDTDNLSNRGGDTFASAGVSNGVYQTTGSPYTDGNTINDALDFMGIASPEFYIGPEGRTPTDINGDGNRDEADRTEIIRRLDMNGDGTVTLEEELAMAILVYGAQDADPGNFEIPRLFRVGFEVQF